MLFGRCVDAAMVGVRTRRGKVRAAVEMARGAMASTEVDRGGQRGCRAPANFYIYWLPRPVRRWAASSEVGLKPTEHIVEGGGHEEHVGAWRRVGHKGHMGGCAGVCG